MEWPEIKVKVPVEYTDTALAIAGQLRNYGIYTEDFSDMEQVAQEVAHIDLIDESLLSRDRANAVLHVYLQTGVNLTEADAFLQERLSAAGIPDFAVEISSVSDQNWENEWKKYYRPIRVGESIVVCPEWERESLLPTLKKEDILLTLDPGKAFGTGSHETTKLVMALLEKMVKKGDYVLDIGCGSGILSVTALLLGAQEALGLDIDPLAVKSSGENAALNNLPPQKAVFRASDLTGAVEAGRKFQLICANIVADEIIRLAGRVGEFLAPGGIFISSGIICEHEDRVAAALTKNKFEIIEVCRDNGWTAIAAKGLKEDGA